MKLRCFSRIAFVLLGLIFFGSMSAVAVSETITLLHTSDLHAHLLPDANHQGGFAELRAAIREQRRLAPDALLLDAGDMVQGTPVSTIYKGVPIYEVANLMGFDATILGNHEFDYGWKQISAFRSTAKFPILCANVVGEDGKVLADAASQVFSVKGVRIGVIGLLTEDLPRLTTPNLLGGITVENIVESVRRELALLQSKADLFIVLGHLRDPESDLIAGTFPQLTAVIAGHPHLSMKEPRKVGSGIVVSVANYGRELGRLDLHWSKELRMVSSIEWRAIPVENINPDPAVLAAVKSWENRVASVVDIPIGTSAREFDKAEVKALTERAFKEQLGVDFAFANVGGIRDKLPQGTILARHIWNIHPFDNLVVIGRFKGKELPPMITPQSEVAAEKEYTLALSDFVAVNQSQMGTNGMKFPETTGKMVREIMIDWVKQQKVLR